MNADEEARLELQELLLDDVQLPSEAAREAMFARTFASEVDAGRELLPPDDLFDASPDDQPDAGPTDQGADPLRSSDGDDIGDEKGIRDDRGPAVDGWAGTADPGADHHPAAEGHDGAGPDHGDGPPHSGDPSPHW